MEYLRKKTSKKSIAKVLILLVVTMCIALYIFIKNNNIKIDTTAWDEKYINGYDILLYGDVRYTNDGKIIDLYTIDGTETNKIYERKIKKSSIDSLKYVNDCFDFCSYKNTYAYINNNENVNFFYNNKLHENYIKKVKEIIFLKNGYIFYQGKDNKYYLSYSGKKIELPNKELDKMVFCYIDNNKNLIRINKDLSSKIIISNANFFFAYGELLEKIYILTNDKKIYSYKCYNDELKCIDENVDDCRFERCGAYYSIKKEIKNISIYDIFKFDDLPILVKPNIFDDAFFDNYGYDYNKYKLALQQYDFDISKNIEKGKWLLKHIKSGYDLELFDAYFNSFEKTEQLQIGKDLFTIYLGMPVDYCDNAANILASKYSKNMRIPFSDCEVDLENDSIKWNNLIDYIEYGGEKSMLEDRYIYNGGIGKYFDENCDFETFINTKIYNHNDFWSNGDEKFKVDNSTYYNISNYKLIYDEDGVYFSSSKEDKYYVDDNVNIIGCNDYGFYYINFNNQSICFFEFYNKDKKSIRISSFHNIIYDIFKGSDDIEKMSTVTSSTYFSYKKLIYDDFSIVENIDERLKKMNCYSDGNDNAKRIEIIPAIRNYFNKLDIKYDNLLSDESINDEYFNIEIKDIDEFIDFNYTSNKEKNEHISINKPLFVPIYDKYKETADFINDIFENHSENVFVPIIKKNIEKFGENVEINLYDISIKEDSNIFYINLKGTLTVDNVFQDEQVEFCLKYDMNDKNYEFE